jgi:hypothetical protein
MDNNSSSKAFVARAEKLIRAFRERRRKRALRYIARLGEELGLFIETTRIRNLSSHDLKQFSAKITEVVHSVQFRGGDFSGVLLRPTTGDYRGYDAESDVIDFPALGDRNRLVWFFDRHLVRRSEALLRERSTYRGPTTLFGNGVRTWQSGSFRVEQLEQDLGIILDIREISQKRVKYRDCALLNVHSAIRTIGREKFADLFSVRLKRSRSVFRVNGYDSKWDSIDCPALAPVAVLEAFFRATLAERTELLAHGKDMFNRGRPIGCLISLDGVLAAFEDDFDTVVDPQSVLELHPWNLRRVLVRLREGIEWVGKGPFAGHRIQPVLSNLHEHEEYYDIETDTLKYKRPESRNVVGQLHSSLCSRERVLKKRLSMKARIDSTATEPQEAENTSFDSQPAQPKTSKNERTKKVAQAEVKALPGAKQLDLAHLVETVDQIGSGHNWFSRLRAKLNQRRTKRDQSEAVDDYTSFYGKVVKAVDEETKLREAINKRERTDRTDAVERAKLDADEQENITRAFTAQSQRERLEGRDGQKSGDEQKMEDAAEYFRQGIAFNVRVKAGKKITTLKELQKWFKKELGEISNDKNLTTAEKKEQEEALNDSFNEQRRELRESVPIFEED